ncbi:MAG: class I SAM-dependent methyltransferase [Myxococcales bacterium]|nr:MAG: class I SAM-dependent methyltransferase [Myxococcales bacterium]
MIAFLLKCYLWLDGLVERFANRVRDAVGGFLEVWLSAEQQSELVHMFYDGRVRDGEELHSWEEPWFLAELPKAPATILVGAAGRGREAQWLAAKGYVVDAFDPRRDSQDELRLCARRSARTSYAEFCDAVLDGRNSAASIFANEHYDAVVLGWSSFSHIIDPEHHARLLEACVRVTGDGPILFSYKQSTTVPKIGRARRVGRTMAQALTYGSPTEKNQRYSYAGRAGFMYAFSDDELIALAKSMTPPRTVHWGSRLSYPHAAFVLEKEAQAMHS